MLRVGQVVGVFGIVGAVKVRSLTDFPDRFAPGAELFANGESHRVEWSREPSTGLVVKFVGVDTRTAAQAWRGRYLEVPDELLRPLPAGRWYHHDLVGLAVATQSGRDLGTLAEVAARPANDVWVARREGDEGRAEEVLIPVIPDAVLRVDLDAGTVTVADWLLDTEEA
jgi:16S rRNA processing protein RimM